MASEESALAILDNVTRLQEEPRNGSDSIEELYTKKFRELVDTAVEELTWLMENSGDDKDRIKICQDILDRAGATRKPERQNAPIIIIKDSEVALLVQAAREAF
jgi:hypothetical protein